MASDAFLHIDGIEGECTDAKHAGKIELFSFNHGVSMPINATSSTSGSRTAGRVMHQDFVFTKQVDKATPMLFKFCNHGEHIPKITLHLHRASSGEKIEYMNYEFVDSVVTSQSIGGSGMDVPTETVTINYMTIKMTYTATDTKDAKKGNVAANWSLMENKEA